MTKEQIASLYPETYSAIQYEVLDSHSKKNGWFTEVDLNSLLCSLQRFANANNGQMKYRSSIDDSIQVKANLLTIRGENFGERADHIIECFKEAQSSTEFLSKLRDPL